MTKVRAKRYRNPGLQGNRPMHDWQRKEAFGLRSQDKWPDAGLPARVIQGVTMMVRPFDKSSLAYSKMVGAGKRRCIAQCPQCGRWVDAGHIGQHLEWHEG